METVPIGEQLLEQLDELRLSLMQLEERLQKSGVERTCGLKKYMGNDCHFYRKSMDLFLRKDYEQLRDMVSSIHRLFSIIEGKQSGSQKA